MAEPDRARSLGIPFSGEPGPLNTITDVQGVEVGHKTMIFGEGSLERGVGPIRTGVTIIHPRGKASIEGVFRRMVYPQRLGGNDRNYLARRARRD